MHINIYFILNGKIISPRVLYAMLKQCEWNEVLYEVVWSCLGTHSIAIALVHHCECHEIKIIVVVVECTHMGF